MALSSHQRIDSSMPGKETNPHSPSLRLPLPSTTPRRPCRLTQPSLSLFPPTQSAQPLTHLPRSSTTHPLPRLPPTDNPVEPALPSSVVSLPSDGQLSRYELTELRSFCGGRASSYSVYQLENVSAVHGFSIVVVVVVVVVVVCAFTVRVVPFISDPVYRYDPLIFEIALPLIECFDRAPHHLIYDRSSTTRVHVGCFSLFSFLFLFFFFFFFFCTPDTRRTNRVIKSDSVGASYSSRTLIIADA